MDNYANTKVVSPKLQLPPASSVITALIVIFLVYALLSGATLRFYASAVFLFYSLVNSMWISVVLLGIFQTILMIPLRIINLILSKHTKEFQEKVKNLEGHYQKDSFFKKNVKQGNLTVLWYIINFFIQTISYFSIGRLFLTDFYSIKLNPSLLYSFVPYPQYPIQDRWFKIPYPAATATKDFGILVVFGVWILAIIIRLGIRKIRTAAKKTQPDEKSKAAPNKLSLITEQISEFADGYLTIFFVVSWFLLRHFPTQLELRIFSGDVSIPNPPLNTITAIGVAITILWLNIPKIMKKAEMARDKGIDNHIIESTQISMFKEALRSAVVLALGAYYITRLIPSAFELSIFTLEIISFLSPFTLDRLILSTRKVNPKVITDIAAEIDT